MKSHRTKCTKCSVNADSWYAFQSVPWKCRNDKWITWKTLKPSLQYPQVVWTSLICQLISLTSLTKHFHVVYTLFIAHTHKSSSWVLLTQQHWYSRSPLCGMLVHTCCISSPCEMQSLEAGSTDVFSGEINIFAERSVCGGNTLGLTRKLARQLQCILDTREQRMSCTAAAW